MAPKRPSEGDIAPDLANIPPAHLAHHDDHANHAHHGLGAHHAHEPHGPRKVARADPSAAASASTTTINTSSTSSLTTTSAANSAASDFSSSVKRRLDKSNRTGQACDRCKVRKIRCDPRPEGCSPCTQNRTPCKTTDRITGRATTRGHAEALEAENRLLRAQLADVTAQLKDLGLEPRALAASTTSPPALDWPSSAPAPDTHPELRPLPDFKPASFGDNYLGVSSADSLLSHINGTSLSVFGAEIDITDFVQSDSHGDYDRSVMSYAHFVNIALRHDVHVQPVPYPDHHELSQYASWYLQSLNPYTMLLDKPTLMNLIWRIGNEPAFEPSPSETVCVHMVLATIKYQIGARNNQPQMMEQSHKHYTYSLSFSNHLLLGHTWQDVQALALIAHHMRNFPKPGPAWIMVTTTFLLAIELGLHRSTKAWTDSSNVDRLEVEMRKRIFWTLHALASNLSGKLGRPMPILLDEVDVEFPEPVPDALPGEESSTSPFQKCSYHVGIQTAKYTVWSSELYRKIYTLRPAAGTYEDTVRRLEDGIKRWRDDIPPELADPARASQENYIYSLYLDAWEQEYQLLLHHPAVCRSTNPDFINANLDKCLVAIDKMLETCNQVRRIKSLDIPWVTLVVYIAAIFTMLFIYYQRRDRMTSADMTKLQEDMNTWLEILGDYGQMLGSGDKLRDAVQKIIEHSLRTINDSIVKRTATESLARAALQTPQEQPVPPMYNNGANYEQYAEQNPAPSESNLPSTSTYAVSQNSSSYTYANGATAPVPQSQQFEQPAYTGGEDAAMSPSHAAALAAAATAAPSSRHNSYSYSAAPPPSDNNYPQQYATNSVTPADWHQWSRTNLQQLPPGDYINSANTLLNMGSRDAATGSGAGHITGNAVEGPTLQGAVGVSNFQWPVVMFGAGSTGHVG